MRVTKKPEERKQEITEAALQLFLKDGYENVSVKDITTKINVAAGLFHYYFHTKEEVFMECVKLDRQKYLDQIKGKDYFPKNAGAVEKINCLIKNSMQNLESRNTLIKEAYTLNSMMLIHQVRDYAIGNLSDIFAELIKQGNEEGVFHCKYPQAAAEIALFGISHHMLRDKERDGTAQDAYMVWEYVYRNRKKLQEIMMDILNMQEPHGLLCYED